MFMAVVLFCHSKLPVMGRFLFRAQEHNMTNGDFAFFTFWSLHGSITNKPWIFYVKDKNDIPRLLRAFYVVKQVCTFHSPVLYTVMDNVVKTLLDSNLNPKCQLDINWPFYRT